MHFSRLRGLAVLACSGLGVLLMASAPAQAHHLMDITGLKPSPINGLLSGLAHPVLGPDHLLFLLALALLGLQRPRRWVLGLLAVALLGSVVGLLWPGLPGAEVLVSLTLVLEALVLLQQAPAALLLPAMAMHGYVLSEAVLGWSTMPLGSYLLGLMLSQGALLLMAMTLCRHGADVLSRRWRGLTALALIAVGSVFAVGQALG